MKTVIVLLLFVTLFCCSTIELVTPLQCYCVELTVSLTTGEILSTEILQDFVYLSETIEKWKSSEGIVVRKDTLQGTATIRMVQCIELNCKN